MAQQLVANLSRRDTLDQIATLKDRDALVIAAVEVENSDRSSEKAVLNRLNIQPGERLNMARLQEDLGRMFP